MTLPRDLPLSDYQALAEFRYELRRFVRFSEEAARAAGIEPQHHQLMLAVKGNPGGEYPRIGELAERMQIQHHSAVELVDRLAKRGLIHRNRGDKDRREVHVQLTARGERVLAELTKHTRAELRSAAPALVEALRKLTPSAESSTAKAAKNGIRRVSRTSIMAARLRRLEEEHVRELGWVGSRKRG